MLSPAACLVIAFSERPSPLTGHDEVGPGRDAAGGGGERAGDIELAMSLFVVGDEMPPWTRGSSAPMRPPSSAATG